MLKNAATFVNGTRTMRNINVEWDDAKVYVKNRNTDQIMQEFSIVETAKDGMAWDVLDGRGDRVRLVAQVGCGCGGMRPYENDESYSGTLERK